MVDATADCSPPAAPRPRDLPRNIARRPRVSRPLAWLAAASALAACGGDAAPTLSVGGISLPEATYSQLRDPERQMLFDLVAFGRSVARDELDPLLAPVVERLQARRDAELLPYLLAARFMGADEEMLRSAYAPRPEWELVVRHVVRLVDSSAPAVRRDSARAVAAEVAARAAAGEDFAALASRFSEEPGAAGRGGLLQPGRRGSWVDPFWEAASSLEPGQISGVVESPYGYHVLRLDDRRPVPFEDADRGALLRRVIPPRVAAGAFEQWAGSEGRVEVDSAAVADVHEAIEGGVALDGTARIATDQTGGVYDAGDLAASWALLVPEEAQRLERADHLALSAWILADAEEVLRGRFAATLAERPSPGAEADRAALRAGMDALGATFGFAPGQSDVELTTVAPRALLSGTPELRSARLRLRTLRPLLRRAYPVEMPTP